MTSPHPRSYLEERISSYRLLFGRVSTYTDFVDIGDQWLCEPHLKYLYAGARKDQKEYGGKEAFKLLVTKIREVYLRAVYQTKRELNNEREKAKGVEKKLKRDIEVRELQLREMEERLRETLEELGKARRLESTKG